MSSATSTRRRPGLQTRHEEAGLKPRPTSEPRNDDAAVDPGFRVWHFFVLMSLIAATFAVIVSRQNTPEHLILISAAVASAGAAAYALYRTLAPLAIPDALGSEPIGDRLRADLEREKMLVLRSIKELEFDRAMGKVSAQDFDEMAGRLRARAIGLMKQLDGGGYRAIIERDLAERLRLRATTSRPDLPPSHKATADKQVGRAAVEQVADRAQPADPWPSDLKVGPTGVCACGVQNDHDARFCKSCGARLEAV